MKKQAFAGIYAVMVKGIYGKHEKLGRVPAARKHKFVRRFFAG